MTGKDPSPGVSRRYCPCREDTRRDFQVLALPTAPDQQPVSFGFWAAILLPYAYFPPTLVLEQEVYGEVVRPAGCLVPYLGRNASFLGL